MSQLWIYIKTNMRANAKQWPALLAMYVVMPVFFSFLMGFSFSSLFVPEETSDPIEVSINNGDNGGTGQALVDTLNTEAMQNYVDIVEGGEEADFIIHIQPEYSQRLEETLVEVESKENASASQETILVQMITEYQNVLVNQQALANEMATINDQAIVEQLVVSLDRVASLSAEQVFEKQQYESQSSLTSNQFTSVSGLIYIFILSLAGSVGMKTKEEMKGLRKRIGVLPLTPAKDVIYGITSDTIMFVLLGAIYMIIWHLIDGNTFVGNPLFYLGWLTLYAFLFQVLNNVLFYFIPDRYANVVYQVFTMIFMIFGFMPIDRLLGENFQDFLSTNYYREIFSEPMYDYIINQQWNNHIGLAFGIVIVGVILTLIVIQLRTRRELKPS